MSGISIKNASATFTKKVAGLALPRRNQLVGEYRLGVDFATSSINHANNAIPLVAIGTPVYNAVGVTVKGASAGGLNTQINPGRDATLIVVRKRVGAGQNMLIVGNQLGNANSFGVGAGTNVVGLYDDDSVSPAKSRFYSNLASGANTSADHNAPITSNWFFEAGTCYWNNFQKLYTYASGVQSVSTSPAAGTGWDNTVRFGTSGGFGVWTCDVLFGGIYSTPLPDAEIDAAYQSVKAYYAYLGVTID